MSAPLLFRFLHGAKERNSFYDREGNFVSRSANIPFRIPAFSSRLASLPLAGRTSTSASYISFPTLREETLGLDFRVPSTGKVFAANLFRTPREHKFAPGHRV